MKVITTFILFTSLNCWADSMVPSQKSHIEKSPVNEKSYDYSFSQSPIGAALNQLLKNSNGSIYNGSLNEYKKQLKIVKSNPSASFLELRLFYAHLEEHNKQEKEFVVHLMNQLNHKQSRDFLSSLKPKKSQI